MTIPREGQGVIAGDFSPADPTQRLLLRFAAYYTAELTVVYTRNGANETEAWEHLRREYPNVRFQPTDLEPLSTETGAAMAKEWAPLLRECCPDLAFIFGADRASAELAAQLRRPFLPLPPVHGHGRNTATPKQSPKRFCLYGPESTAKSAAGQQLARALSTVHVEEYARPYAAARGNSCVLEDMTLIARGQRAAERTFAPLANGALLVDQCLTTTMIWSETLYGDCPDWLRDAAAREQHDHYFLADIDIPWIYDPQRCLPEPEDRRVFFERCRDELEKHGRVYTLLRGSPEQRCATALERARALLDAAS